MHALSEAYRVLSKQGKAIFFEPIENSNLFNLIQNLFPVGSKESEYYRPSILQWKEWDNYLGIHDDRSMSTKELIESGQRIFQYIHLSPYNLTLRLERLIGHKYRRILISVDNFLFGIFPKLKYFCQAVLVAYRK